MTPETVDPSNLGGRPGDDIAIRRKIADTKGDTMDSFKSLKDHVYQYISEKINDGSLLPETKINEKMVVDDMNISRTPVREALIQLATEGYLQSIPRKGFIVKRVDKNKAREVYGLLGVLEGFAASLSVNGITREDIDHLLQYYEQMETAIETDDIKAYYTYQNLFHDIYIQKSGNQELIKVIQLLKKIFIRQTYTLEKGGGLKKVLKTTNQEHKTIIDLFEERNGAELERFLRCHHWNPELAFYDTV